MFRETREKIRKRVTLKKKSDPGKLTIPFLVKGIEFPHALCETGASVSILPRVMADHLGLQVEPSNELFTFVDCSQKNSGGIVKDLELRIGNAPVPVDFHVLDIKLNWNSSLLLERAFLSTVGVVCNLQSNQLCLTLIDPDTHYDPIPVKKSQTFSRRINDPGIIAACHCRVEYETDYSTLEEWENDYYNPAIAAYIRKNLHTEEYDEAYEEERATEYKAILDEEDTLLHHSSWKMNAPSIDIPRSPLIDTQPHQRNRKRASTDITDYPSIDTEVDCVQEGDYLIGSWVSHMRNYSTCKDAMKYIREMLLGDEHEPAIRSTEQDVHRSTSNLQHRSTMLIQHRSTSTINQKPLDPDGYARAIDGRTLHVSREDIADILQTANGADNLFLHQRNIPEYQQANIKEFYDTAGGIGRCFQKRSRHPTQPLIDIDVLTSVDRHPEFGRRAFDLFGAKKFYCEEKHEYGFYRDDQGYARDLEGYTIHVHNRDIRRLLERASRDKPSYISSGEGREAARRRFRSRKSDELRRFALVTIDVRPFISIDEAQSESIDMISRASIDDTDRVKRILQCRENSDSRGGSYGKKSKEKKGKSGEASEEGANEKEKESFRKRVFRIPIDKPFEDAYYTQRLWMFFRETREKEEDIKRMFRASVSILPRVMADHLGLQVEPSNELFTFVDCSQKNSGGIVKDLEVQIGNALVPVDFHVLDIKLNWNSSLFLGRAFLSIVEAVCNLQSNQLCLTLIDLDTHYDPIPVKKSQTFSRRINDPGIIAACHCGVEYETDYSASIETHTATSIYSGHQRSTDRRQEESVDNSLEEWENDYYNPAIAAYIRQNLYTEEYDEDYEKERATEYKAILDEEDTLLHHFSWKMNAPSTDIPRSPSIDTQPHQRNRK
ncbi:hypothetical protein DY000_02052961 [Brassica cretica]|uniref:Aspartic peptidase DDI1-type domain-containing protein n=1 Tax=Brassica cretica TaxID=69181 RepID=A0ABQ7AKL0_BRACR|nr:hypothetical protein DY000_02052961 [Brassica cretica]